VLKRKEGHICYRKSQGRFSDSKQPDYSPDFLCLNGFNHLIIWTFNQKRKEEDMISERKRNDFLKFICDATEDQKLADAFFIKKTEQDLYEFFQEKGYKDIPRNDCEDILASAKNMRGRGVNGEGEPIVIDPTGTKSY